MAADLLHRVGGQVDAGAGRPGALPEQLDARRQAQLRQQVHRFRREAQRGPAGGEHPQVLGHRHQGARQLGGAAQDMLAVVQHQQCRAGTEQGRDAGDDAGGDGALARGASGPAGAQGGRDLAGHVAVGGDAGERDEVHDPLLRLAAHHLRETGLAEAAGTIEVIRTERSRSATAAMSSSRPSSGLGS